MKKQTRHFLTFIEPRLHAKKYENLMRGFEDRGKKTRFGQKEGFLGIKTPLGGKQEFSAKKRKRHFFTVTEPQVHEKNQKNLMRGFLRKSGRTDVRTYGRTDGQA